MSSLDALSGAPTDRAAQSAEAMRWTVGVTERIDEVSRAWLSLEVSGLATPYQTLGWQRAAFEHLHVGRSPCIVSLRDRTGRTVALFPLVRIRRAGVTMASFPGGKHANYNMGLFDPAAAAAMTADEVREALHEAARTAGIDLFDFRNQPESWSGVANPLALLPRQAAASAAWRADLTRDADAFVRSLMSSESRKKLRHKERKLGDFGPVTYVEAASPEQAERMLEAFFAQKAARFAAMGLANPFEDAAVRAFLRQAAAAALADGPPAPISLFAMTVGGRIVAVFGGIVHAGRFSGMFTSFDADPAVAKHSPGDLLLLDLVKTMCGRGLNAFDLGAGDAAYKNDYCAIREQLFDSFLPVTLKGRAAAAALSAGMRGRVLLKRALTQAEPLLRKARAWRGKR